MNFITMNKKPNFESQVLTRLAVIENKLDGWPDLKRTVYANENRSMLPSNAFSYDAS